MKTLTAAMTNNQFPSISAFGAHIITYTSDKGLPVCQWHGYIMEGKSTRSIDMTIATKKGIKTWLKITTQSTIAEIQTILKGYSRLPPSSHSSMWFKLRGANLFTNKIMAQL